LRTLNAPDEFALSAQDVRLAVDYYRDKKGADLPLITVSLGDHLALAALGQERSKRWTFSLWLQLWMAFSII
jgi:hypothetical protein